MLIHGMPDDIRHEVERSLGKKPEWLRIPEPGVEAGHLFVTHRGELADRLPGLLPLLARDGFIWISWPKNASKVPTDVTEDVIREVALPLLLVDVKVCAVDEVWSGLKLVIRKEHR